MFVVQIPSAAASCMELGQSRTGDVHRIDGADGIDSWCQIEGPPLQDPESGNSRLRETFAALIMSRGQMSPSASIVSNIPLIKPTENNKVSNAFDGLSIEGDSGDRGTCDGIAPHGDHASFRGSVAVVRGESARTTSTESIGVIGKIVSGNGELGYASIWGTEATEMSELVVTQSEGVTCHENLCLRCMLGDVQAPMSTQNMRSTLAEINEGQSSTFPQAWTTPKWSGGSAHPCCRLEITDSKKMVRPDVKLVYEHEAVLIILVGEFHVLDVKKKP
ncbi:hypothetical protein BC826DRAFT_971981 [Russula brevipes]|nr:hypothetical protein BC826DRAFT_971981 [Russula brevipes]